MVRFGWSNSELKVGGLLPILQKGNFKVVNNLHASAGSVETQNFDSAKFAAGDELAVGFYYKSWFFAATILLAKWETGYVAQDSILANSRKHPIAK